MKLIFKLPAKMSNRLRHQNVNDLWLFVQLGLLIRICYCYFIVVFSSFFFALYSAVVSAIVQCVPIIVHKLDPVEYSKDHVQPFRRLIYYSLWLVDWPIARATPMLTNLTGASFRCG